MKNCPATRNEKNNKKIMPFHNRNRLTLSKNFIWGMGFPIFLLFARDMKKK
jgi:hypothetical protein